MKCLQHCWYRSDWKKGVLWKSCQWNPQTKKKHSQLALASKFFTNLPSFVAALCFLLVSLKGVCFLIGNCMHMHAFWYFSMCKKLFNRSKMHYYWKNGKFTASMFVFTMTALKPNLGRHFRHQCNPLRKPDSSKHFARVFP